MRTLNACPICKNTGLRRLFSCHIEYTGDLAQEEIRDEDYCQTPGLFDATRNEIMFRHLLKTRESVTFTFLLCRTCGFIFFNPRWDDQDIARKYDAIHQYHSKEDERQPEKFPLDEHRAAMIYNIVSRFHRLENADVLDIGGSAGYNLARFTKHNRCSVVDFEPRIMMPDVSYLGKDLSDIKPGKKFDIILLCHIIEHLVDPIAFLKNARDHLEDSGLLYLEVPLGCFYEYKNLRNYITHLNFFSNAALEFSLYESGFCPLFLKVRVTPYRWFYLVSIVCVARKEQQNRPPAHGYLKTLWQMRNPVNFFYKGLAKIKTHLR